MNVSLLILIPTRNRADLAVQAVKSVLSQVAGTTTRVVISDNSTKADQSSLLEDFVAGQKANNLTLIRPVKPLAMTAHWEWAFGQVMTTTNASHFTILTDRMTFKRGALHSILEILERFPSDILTYTYDRIDDVSTPIIYRPIPRSGQLLRIDSSNLLNMSSRMAFSSCLPRMLNSIAPRPSLERVRSSFGSIFASVSPDFCYCFRCLDLEESILYYDESVLLNYALNRSNGASSSRGIPSDDSRDFIENLRHGDMNANTPLPKIMTVGNAVVNEYNVVMKDSKNSKFKAIDQKTYLDYLANEVCAYENKELRLLTLAYLRTTGWKPELRFRLRRGMPKLAKLMLYPLTKKFRSIDDALAYGSARFFRELPGLHLARRRFQAVVVPWGDGLSRDR